MKRLLSLLLIICSLFAKAQTIMPRVVDAVNNKPLAYAIVIYDSRLRVTYTDVNGYFTLTIDSLKKNDSVTIQYLGYIKQVLQVGNLSNDLIVKMTREDKSLQPVFVSNCPRYESFTLNKKMRNIRQYVGPG